MFFFLTIAVIAMLVRLETVIPAQAGAYLLMFWQYSISDIK